MNYYILGNTSKDIISVSPDEYIEWELKNQERRIISRNRVFINDIEVYISTVFLGLDHSHNPGIGEPVVFETMVFGGKNDEYQNRYTTYREACEGHLKILKAVMENEELTYS